MSLDEDAKERRSREFRDFILSLPAEMSEQRDRWARQIAVEAAEHTRCEDIELCVAAMRDAGVKPEVIVCCLQKYWDISREDAHFRTWREGPRRRFEVYLVDMGMTRNQARNWSICFAHLLDGEPSLAQKSLEAQIKTVEDKMREQDAP